jgi:hypothetical protein
VKFKKKINFDYVLKTETTGELCETKRMELIAKILFYPGEWLGAMGLAQLFFQPRQLDL